MKAAARMWRAYICQNSTVFPVLQALCIVARQTIYN